MTIGLDPVAENWYHHLDKGQAFRVIDVDREGEAVEIQYFDGDLEELDLESWYALEIELAAPPENWSGPLDVAEPDDLGTQVTDTSDADWAAPLAEIPAADRSIADSYRSFSINDSRPPGIHSTISISVLRL